MAMESLEDQKETSSEESEHGVINVLNDGISQLPEEIKHHILSLLPTRDATRMATLSNTWRSVWTSFPILDFDETFFQLDLEQSVMHPRPKRERDSDFKQVLQKVHQKNSAMSLMRRDKFINYVDNSLLQRCRKTSIQKFRVCLADLSKCHMDLPHSNMDQWIRLATESNVEELVIDMSLILLWTCSTRGISGIPYQRYCLPQIVFAAESITVLEIKRCKLEPSSDINLSSLKTLSLHHVHAEEGVIQHLICSCPVLQILTLDNCYGLQHLQFSAPRLQILKVRQIKRIISFAVDVPNLQSFTFRYEEQCEPFEINAVGLKTLRLSTKITDESLESLISKWPHLENLNLKYCAGFKKLKICNHQLKNLALSTWSDIVAEIDAPNLLSFKYDGIPQFSLMNTSSQLEAELCLNPVKQDSNWFSKLRHLLAWFDHVRSLTLHCKYVESLIIPEELRENWVPPLCDLKHLQLKTSLESSKAKLVDSWRWSCPNLETLTIVSGSTHETLKFEYNNPEGQRRRSKLLQILSSQPFLLKSVHSIC